MELKIGADPELFLENNGTFFSAHNLIKGTKKAPFKVKDGAVQVDGMALEFNIDPAKNAKEFRHNIESVLKTLRNMVPHELLFSNKATAFFSKEYLASVPPEAMVLGCDPDYNAYDKQENPPLNIKKLKNKRYAGGHIHIGWTEDVDPLESQHFLCCCQLAIQLDYFLGIPALFLDKDHSRRQFYGAPGNFRPKPYGMEYRSLSNFWIHDSRYIDFVFNQTKKAFSLIAEEGTDYGELYGSNAYHIILHNNYISATYFLKNSHGILSADNMLTELSRNSLVSFNKQIQEGHRNHQDSGQEYFLTMVAPENINDIEENFGIPLQGLENN